MKKPPIVETIEEMCSRIGIRDDWNYILLGDGSGSVGHRPCGWGCLMFHRLTGDCTAWHGAANRGTVNAAEMLAYVLPLNAVLNEAAKRWQASGYSPVNVDIVTDSKYAIGDGISGNVTNSALRSLFRHVEQEGLILRWHHEPGKTTERNVYVDALSKIARVIYNESVAGKVSELHAVDFTTAPGEEGDGEDGHCEDPDANAA